MLSSDALCSRIPDNGTCLEIPVMRTLHQHNVSGRPDCGDTKLSLAPLLMLYALVWLICDKNRFLSNVAMANGT